MRDIPHSLNCCEPPWAKLDKYYLACRKFLRVRTTSTLRSIDRVDFFGQCLRRGNLMRSVSWFFAAVTVAVILLVYWATR